MKIDTLNFLNNLLATHDEKLFHPYIDVLVQVILNKNWHGYYLKKVQKKNILFIFQPVIRCIQDSFYKIASDALLVSQQLAKILRSALNSNINCMNHVNELYKATLARLKQTDIDQEVKERAIVCV